MLEAKANDQEHKRKCSQKNFFSGDLQQKKGLQKKFSGVLPVKNAF